VGVRPNWTDFALSWGFGIGGVSGLSLVIGVAGAARDKGPRRKKSGRRVQGGAGAYYGMARCGAGGFVDPGAAA